MTDTKRDGEVSAATDCSSCFFFHKGSDDEHGVYGRCRRLPPVLSPLSKDESEEFEWSDDGTFEGRYEHSFINWVQPAVTNDDWCGEYQDAST